MRLTHLAAAAALALSQAASAAEPIKICAAENELPYSNKDGQGFENKLAELIGQALGRPVENVWWSDPRYYVRDFLDKGLCDVAWAWTQAIRAWSPPSRITAPATCSSTARRRA